MSMQKALAEFQQAHTKRSALDLAQALSPSIANRHDRLYDFWRSSNEVDVERDVRTAMYRMGMPTQEAKGWADVFVDFWRAVDKAMKMKEAQSQGRQSERLAVDVYDAWKDLVSTLQKYIGNGVLPPWIIFTLYYVANDLRKFAIEADAQLAKAKPVTFSAGFQDDIVATTPKNEKLEEAARVFNRIFALCMSDRNPNMSESRKWAVYCIANLQFKTYFKVTFPDIIPDVAKAKHATAQEDCIMQEHCQIHRSPGRYAAVGRLSCSTPSHIYILLWSDIFLARRLPKGLVPDIQSLFPRLTLCRH